MRLFFCLLFLCTSAFSGDFKTAATELTGELKSLNEKLDADRKSRFTERQKLQRQAAIGESAIEKKNAENAENSKSAELLQREIFSLEKEISGIDRLLNSTEKEMIQLRRELEAVIPQVEIPQYRKSLDTFDKNPVVESLASTVSKVTT